MNWVSSVPDEHLVVVETHLMAAEWNVEAAMRWMNLAGREATMMMTASNVERLTVAGAAADDGIGWYIAVGVTHPTVTVTDKQLELVLDVLATSVGHIGAALAGNDLYSEREREMSNWYCRVCSVSFELTLAGSKSPS